MATVKKNVKRKLLEAREIISKTKTKKDGRNTYSKYDYFTPDTVSKLVGDACIKVGLLHVFCLKRDDIGYFGELIIHDTESEGVVEFKMVTDIPDLTATNITQKIGGSATYTQRYLEMSAFGIVDNNLDFDSQDNRDKKTTTKKPSVKKLTQKQVDSIKAKFEKKILPSKAEITKTSAWIVKFEDNDLRKGLIKFIKSKIDSKEAKEMQAN